MKKIEVPSGAPTFGSSSSISMTDILSDHQTVKAAIIQGTVNLIGLLCLIIMYYNYILLEPYFYPLFWAVLISIPLHAVKKSLIDMICAKGNGKQGISFTGIIFTLVKLLLKFLFGSSWVYVSVVPKYYIRQVGRISQRDSSISPSSEPRVSAGVSSGDTADGSMPKEPSEALQSPSFVIEEKISKEINSSESGPYISLLLRVSGLYILYLCLHSVLVENFVLVISFIGAMALIYLIYHVYLRIYRTYFEGMISRWSAKLRSFLSWLDGILGHIPSKCRRKLASGVERGRHIYQNVRDDVKTESMNQIQTIVVTVLLFSLIAFSVIFTLFFCFQFVTEVHTVARGTVRLVNETVIHNDMFQDAAFKDQLQSTVDDAMDKGVSWANGQLKSRFPGYNLTVEDLIEKVQESYYSLFHPFATDEFGEPIENQGPGSKDQSNHPPLVGDSSGKGSETKGRSPFFLFQKGKKKDQKGKSNGGSSSFKNAFPFTHTIIRRLLAGNFTVLYQVDELKASFEEIRTGSMKLVQSLFNYDKESIERTMAYLEENLISFGQLLLTHSSSLLGFLSVFLLNLFNFFMYSFNVIAEVLLFLATLNCLLTADKSALDYLSVMLKDVDRDQVLRSSIEKAIKGVFLTTLKMFLFHSLFTWLTFTFFNVSFVYIGTFLTGLIAIIPIASPMYIVIPACLELYLKNETISAIILFTSHIVASWVVDPAIYSDITDSHPYFSALSIVLGLWAFGWQGIVIGPLLGCLPVIAFHLYSEMLAS